MLLTRPFDAFINPDKLPLCGFRGWLVVTNEHPLVTWLHTCPYSILYVYVLLYYGEANTDL